ncbi:MAG: hypothetical protein ACI9WC_003877 [Arenicella sp.]|jgi:uncharacterized protein (TIGR01244 family)
MNWLNKFKISLPPLPTPPPVHAADRISLLQLSALVLVAVLIHFTIAKPIIGIYALIVWALKTFSVYKAGSNPPRLLVLLLTIMSFALVLVLYGGWNGQRAGISFLVLLVSLKFLESKTLRDYYMVCLILFFLASSSFLFNSSLSSIFLVLGYSVLVTTVMIRITNPTPTPLWETIRAAGSFMLRALPLAILLFFFFPRIQGNFGFIPSQDEARGDNKLNDSLLAGDFANRAFDNSLAFRVEFDGATPEYEARYWRAKVMTKEQNFQWSVELPTAQDIKAAKSRPPQAFNPQWAAAERFTYEVIHEPSGDSFVPFLDYAWNQTIGTQLDDHSVYLDNNVDSVFAYRAVSSSATTIRSEGLINFGALTRTQSIPKARTLALLSQWRAQTSSDQELIEHVYQYFEQPQFTYTLLPPELGDNPVEEFLFEVQSGYCEHYASIFTILMRWLEIPSRVVVGYQGGSQNEVGGFIEVRYSDAHAWSEVWVDGSWQRVDPTAAISPDRIIYGMDALMSIWDGVPLNGNSTGRALSNYLNPTGFAKTFRQLTDSWGNIGYQWNKWVVNYDFDAQRQLLSALGLKHRNSLYTLVALVIIGTILFMLFYFWQLFPRAIRIAPAQQVYLDFVSRFKRHDLVKQPSDTPNEFAAKAKSKFPQQAQEIGDINNAYVQIRYGQDQVNSSNQIESFKQQVKRFKLKSNVRSSTNIEQNNFMTHLSDLLYVAGQLSTVDIQQAAAAGIKTIINNRPDDEEPGQLNHQDASSLASSLGLDYHYLPMPNGQPMPANLVDDFYKILEDSDQPVLAHCRSGMRSSVIWAMGQIKNGKTDPDQAIAAATAANIPLGNARALLESITS